MIIYKSPQGDIKKLDDATDIDIPKQKTITFSGLSKEKLYLSLHKAFNQGTIPILYDKNIKSIDEKVGSLSLDTLPQDTAVIFFTSGTTGEPTGVLKDKNNIMKELEVLQRMFLPFGFEQVIVTVPLIHIYGFLTGVLLPKALDADVILKEEFMPHELIELADNKKTLCITNPVFLKALNRLNVEKQYKNITFLSSTGALDKEIAKSLNKKLDSTIYQLFGSTETGGIAYKVNDETLWKPLEYVNIGTNGSNLSVDSPFISSYALGSTLVKIEKPFITTDIVEIQGNAFKLLGRESEIIKISGKRISILEIETFLEQSELIEEALVKLVYHVASHKDEQLDISIVGSVNLDALKKEVKRILQYNYKNINMRTTITRVDAIAKNHMNKKLRR